LRIKKTHLEKEKGEKGWNVQSLDPARDKHRIPIEGIGTGKE
jgi:hypothetical protein